MDSYKIIGKNSRRRDGQEKVNGKIRYTDDLHVPGMLFTAFVTSPHAHAEITSIKIAGAMKEKGVLFTDLTEIFKTIPETVYSDACCHYNLFGNEIIAEEIANVINSSLDS